MSARAVLRGLALAALLSGAGACKVGPDYEPPETTLPPGFAEVGRVDPSAPAPIQPDGAPAALERWWTTFADPTLDDLVARALQANTDLRAAEARVREARARRGVVAGELYPEIDATAGAFRRRTSGNVDPSFGGGITRDLYQAGFDALWELDLFGGARRDVDAAQADLEALVEDRRSVLVTLLAEVARNYVELRGAQRQAAIARENLEAQRGTLDLTRIRSEAGLASELDVARAEAQVRTTAAEIPAFESSAQRSIHALCVLLARPPGALDAELSIAGPIPAAPERVLVGMPSDLLRRRPDVRRAERELAAATARIGVATADLFPRFSLTGGLGLESSETGDLVDADSRFWSLGAGLRWPILDFGRIRGRIDVADAREEQAALAYEAVVLASLREVEDALVGFVEEQRRRAEFAGAREANRRAVELALQLHQQGLSDFLSVLQAQRDLFASEDALVESESAIASELVALYKALGGGWEIEGEEVEPLERGSAGERTLDLGAP